MGLEGVFARISCSSSQPKKRNPDPEPFLVGWDLLVDFFLVFLKTKVHSDGTMAYLPTFTTKMNYRRKENKNILH